MNLRFYLFLIFAVLIPKESIKASCHNVDISGTNLTCHESNDGSASISISNGSGDYNIKWSTGDTDVLSISNLSAGYYDVEVTDNITGCYRFAIISITEPDALSASLTADHVNCKGDATGSLTLSASGGTKDYSYLWSTGASTANLEDVAAGTYSLTISDANGCDYDLSGTITEPTQALDAAISHTEISCHDEADATAEVEAWGGTPHYTYEWSNGDASQSIDDITAGTYTVTVTDNKGCIKTQTSTINNPPELTYTKQSVNNNCADAAEGEASINVSGGTKPYAYQWANSEYMLSHDTSSIDKLATDNYSLTVSDANGCQFIESFNITSPEALSTTITGTNATFSGASNGQIELTVEGGISPYSYNWSNGITTQNNPDVPAGDYTVTVSDLNGCETQASITIEEPKSPLSFTYTKTNVSCNNGSDGKITLYPEGGVEPYELQWSNGSKLDYLNELQAGDYTCTLTDANETKFIDTITINEPQPLSLSFTSKDISCFAGQDGEIDLRVNGGTTPYKYQWYSPDYALSTVEQDMTNAKAGQYMVAVTDSNGCEASISAELNQPEPLELELEGEDILCNGESTGEIYTSVQGGTKDYSYSWSNGDNDANPKQLPADAYSVTVTDNQGCEVFSSITLYEPPPIEINLLSTPVSCNAQKDGKIESSVSGGSGAYSYIWSSDETKENIKNLNEGKYHVTVSDIYECKETASAVVDKSDLDCINIPNSFTPNGDGYNDTWVIRNAYLFPECTVHVFNQWGNIIYESTGYSKPWNGKYQGSIVPSGTYYYIFRTTPESPERTGTLTILK